MKMDGRNHGHHKYEGGRLPPTSLLRIITYFSQFATLLCSLNLRGGRTAWEYRRTIRIFQRGGRHDDPLEILLIQFYSSHNLCSWGRTRRDARPSNSNKILSGPRDNFCVVSVFGAWVEFSCVFIYFNELWLPVGTGCTVQFSPSGQSSPASQHGIEPDGRGRRLTDWVRNSITERVKI